MTKPITEKRLFIVSNRLPIQITELENKVQIKPSAGGLVSAMNGYLQKSGGAFDSVFWTGVPGCSTSAWMKAGARIPSSTYTFLPVLVRNDPYDGYYNGFSNSVLWPLFHYFPSYAEYDFSNYLRYTQVNELFAELLAKHLRPTDTVWIHDYHLLPLARLLRRHFPELTIGFFLHIPFPSFELFRLLPRNWQEELLEGLLGADLIGFHTIDYATHFLQSVQMVLGLEHNMHVLRYGDRLIKIDVFPISIDYACFHQAYDEKKVATLRKDLLQSQDGKQIIFSVDRLDYTKGVYNRLKAYEYFLAENPDFREKVVFILVIVPSRDSIPKYAERKRMIDETISHINSRTGTLHRQPIIYQYHHLGFEEMIALYTGSDVALITPLRDSMNLVAKEFVASRKDKRGVLVLSEMAGAARELTQALAVNPNDIRDMARKIKQALQMPLSEQAHRLAPMQRRVERYQVTTWAEDFLTELRKTKALQEEFQIRFVDAYTQRTLMDAYQQSRKRLLLLDYDGTLVPFSATPEEAAPAPSLLQLLHRLGTQDENEVLIISGRSRAWLDLWFGKFPLGLIGEHGAQCKFPDGSWVTHAGGRNEWQEPVRRIMEVYERRCAFTFTEVKEFSLVWHYRNALPEQGKVRALELLTELKGFTHNRNLQVLCGNKTIEVRNSGMDKGAAVNRLIHQGDYPFVLAVGDDTTDEDMFRMLAGNPGSFTINVGAEASFAQYNLYIPHMVVSLLDTLSHLRYHGEWGKRADHHFR